MKNHYTTTKTGRNRWLLSLLITCLVLSSNVFAQLSGTKNIPADYATITAAVNALNAAGVGAGGVTFNVPAGYTETLSGRINLTATGTVSNPIIFQKSGAGANPILTSYAGAALAGSATPDGMWSLNGSDYVTIDGINLTEAAGNSTPTTQMEYGYGLFKASATDGANNNTIQNCVITLNRNNTTTGGSPFFHGSTGIALAPCAPTTGTAVTAVTSLSGASSNNRFYSNTIQNVNTGISIIGYAGATPFTLCDFNNDIGGASAGTGNSILNFGGGTTPANACAAVYHKDQWSANISYNTVNNNNGSGSNHAATNRGIFMQAASVGASATINNNSVTITGGTSTTAIDWAIDCEMAQSGNASGNTISISNNTISITKTTATAVALTAIWAQSAPATLSINGNTITTFNCNSTSTSTTDVGVIRSGLGGIGTLNINNNTIGGVTFNGTTGTHYIIGVSGTSPAAAVNINGNGISGVTLNGVTSKIFRAIYNATALTTAAISISNNSFQNIAYTAGTPTGEFALIYAAGSPASWTISSNTLTGSLSIPTTGTMYFIYNSQSTALGTVSNNNLTGTGVTRTGASGATYGYYNASGPTGTFTFSGNTYSNITQTASSGLFYGIYLLTSTNCTQKIQNNTYSNISIGAGTLYGINHNYGNTGSEISGNTVSGLSGTGTVAGINIGATASNSMNVFNNKVNGITTTGATSVASGIIHAAGLNTSIYNNKIYNINGNSASASAVGLTISAGTSITAYNNIIGDINAPTANAANAVIGINVTGGTTVNLYYNTVRLGASSSGALFGSSALSASVTPALTVRNNIFVNNSTFSGAGISAAYRRSAATPGTHNAASNNNILYAGAASANNLIFYDGTNSDQTLGDFQTRFAPAEAASKTQNPSFTSLTGSNAGFLHINPALSSLASNGAVNISGITTDFDADIRQGNGGYAGTGTAPDIGADEFEAIISTSNDIGADLLVTPASTGCFSNVQTVVVRVSNFGPAIDFSVDPATLTVNITGAATATLTATLSGTLPLNGTMNVTLTGTFDMSVNGVYTFNAFTTCISDATPANNAMLAVNRTRAAVAAGTLSASNNTYCLSGTPTLTLAGAANGTSQWQQSTTSASGPWSNISGTTTYTPGAALTQTTYYQVQTTCLIDAPTSNVITVTVNNPSLISTNSPQNVCGSGTVNFTANVSSGATANWYTAASGGTPIASSTLSYSPFVTTTTDFWVAATSGGSTSNVGKVSTPGSDGNYTLEAGLLFDAQSSFTLNSVYIYPIGTGAGVVNIALKNSAGTTLQSTAFNCTGTTTPGVKTLVPLGWNVPVGTGYFLDMTSRTGLVASLLRDLASSSPFPYTIPGAISITSGRLGATGTSTSYYFFYDWSVSTGCEGPRTMVTANVTTAPTITPNASLSLVCSGGATNLTVNSSNDPNYSYVWTPGNLSGSSINVNPSASTNYTVTATDNTAGPFAGCNTTANLAITTQPATATVLGSPESICSSSGSTTLSLSPSTYPSGSLQWQSSPNGTTYTNISGETNDTYITPTLTSSTYYRAVIKNGNNVTCIQPTKQIVVGVPTLNGTTDDTRCGYGQASLQASASAGATVKWYTTSAGGTPIGTGSPFLTPNINTTTTFYAGAETGYGLPVPVVTGAGATTSATYSNPFYSLFSNLHTQHLILGSELTALGMTAGKITSFSVNITSAGTLPMLDLSIKIGTTTASTMAAFVSNAGFQTVYTSPSLMPVLGTNTITFSSPFTWDGSSNIVIEICHGNSGSTATMSRTMSMNATAYVSSIKTHRTVGTAGTTQCGDNTTNILTYSTRPNYTFTYQPICSSARTAVVATVTPSPTITVSSPNTNICPGGNTTISVSSGNDPDYTYIWSSNPPGFSASGPGPHTVSPSATTKYYVLATDNTAGANADCAYLDSITIINGGTLVGGAVSANLAEHCVSGSSILTTTASGGTIQWQTSTVSNSGPWSNVGNGGSTYTTPTLTQTAYYRTTVSCDVTTIPSSNVQTITVNNPSIASQSPASRCGYGSVTLGATPSLGATINWYTASTGGIPIATGNTFTTPNLSATTNYYAAASNGGTTQFAGRLAPQAGAATVLSTYGQDFTVTQAFILNSVQVISTTGTSITVSLYSSGGTTQLLTTGAVSVPINTTNTINLGWNIAPGTYRICANAMTGNFIRENSTVTYPFAVSTVAQINGFVSSITGTVTTSASYYWFYNWSITTGCEGLRQMITATVNNPASIAISPTSTFPAVCNNGSTTLNVSSPNDPNYTYTWSSVPAGFTASTAGPHVVTPVANTKYFIYAIDNTAGANAGCAAYDSITVVYSNSTPTAGTVSATQSSLCISGTTTLSVTGASGGAIQWQSSSVSASGPWTNVGTGSSTYTTPTLTQTTYFQTVTSCSGTTVSSNVETITVNNPSITGTTPASRIATGTLTLGAAVSSGATANWYTAATGGTSIATGPTYTTPVISSTTNYFVSASQGGNSGLTIPGDGNWNHFTTTGAFQTTTNTGAILTVLQPLTLTSMDIYPSAALGTAFTVEARTGSASGTTFLSYSTLTTVVNSTSPTVAQTLNVNWVLPAGTYYIVFPSTSVNPNTWRSDATHTLPWVLPTYASLDYALTPSYQYYFYNLTLATGCESARTQVTATIIPAPLDASITMVTPTNPAILGSNTVSVNITNNSATAPITSINLSYTDGSVTRTQNFTGLNIAAGATQLFTFTTPYVATGNFTMYAKINTVNGTIDASQANDQTPTINYCVGLNGTYTINSANPTGGSNFNNLTDVAIALNCGVAGPVVFNMQSSFTEQVTIAAINGVSATNTITFNGNGNSLSFAATVSTAPHTLALNGADYLRFNDLIINGSGTTYALVCHLYNGADNNMFTNCTFNAPANGTSTTQVPFSISGSATSATTAGTSGNNNIITGCTMYSGYYNTVLYGASGSPNTGNQVINCNLLDFYFYGSYNVYQNGAIIRGNTIERPTRTNSSTFYGIYLSTACTNMLVEKNKLRNAFGTNTTTTSSAYCLYGSAASTSGNENKFYNNLVSDISSAGLIYGIYSNSYYKIYHNTIALNHVLSTSTSVAYGIYATSGTGSSMKNNVISITRGGTASKYGLYYVSNPASSNNNNIHVNSAAGTNYIAYNGTAYSTLSAWTTANPTFDVLSTSVDPSFADPLNYDYTPTAQAMNAIGAPLGFTDDILGTTRDLVAPDAGAYEFANATAPPACLTSVTVNNAACITNTSLSWTKPSGYPSGYTLTLYDNAVPVPNYIEYLTDLGNKLNYSLPILAPNTTYYYLLEPYNILGTASGCSIGSFTSGPQQSVSPSVALVAPPTPAVTYNLGAEGVTPPALPCGVTKENADQLGTSAWYTSSIAPHSGLNHMRIDKNPDNTTALDDYFFTIPINVTAGKVYRISWWERVSSASFT